MNSEHAVQSHGTGITDLNRYAQAESIQGWSSYKTYSGLEAPRGTNRSFFQYSPLPSSIVGYDGVTNAFNKYCSEMGVQCTVTMDPSDFQQLMHFQVVGNDDVLISHQGKSRVMAPGDSWLLKTTRLDMDTFRTMDCLPRISKMVNGNV